MSPQASDIFLSIQQLASDIHEKRMKYIDLIKEQTSFADTRKILSEVKELEQRKKELQIELSMLMKYHRTA
jgi:hypothetical protein